MVTILSSFFWLQVQNYLQSGVCLYVAPPATKICILLWSLQGSRDAIQRLLPSLVRSKAQVWRRPALSRFPDPVSVRLIMSVGHLGRFLTSRRGFASSVWGRSSSSILVTKALYSSRSLVASVSRVKIMRAMTKPVECRIYHSSYHWLHHILIPVPERERRAVKWPKMIQYLYCVYIYHAKVVLSYTVASINT